MVFELLPPKPDWGERAVGIPVQSLQAKIRRQTPLSGKETAALVAILKRYHLTTV
jgi:hypothetical protein